jgi:5'-nucleotidase
VTGRLRILVTNDDGIDAPGIRALAEAAIHYGAEVVVAAPVSEYSGASASVSAVESDGHVVLSARDFEGMPDVTAYAIEGSPGFIALIGTRGAFRFSPDVVLSGVNRGANAGYAVLHSGTVGAALTAAETGCRGIAVSLDVLASSSATATTGGNAMSPSALASIVERGEPERNWGTAASLATRLLTALMATPPGTVLNLNVPDVDEHNLRGVRRARLARFGQVQMSVAHAGFGSVRVSLGDPDEPPEPGTDLALLADRYATVTPLCVVSEVYGLTLDLSGVTG